EDIGIPLSILTDAIEEERLLSTTYVGGDSSVAERLAAAREATDAAKADLAAKSSSRWVDWTASDELRQQMADFETAYAELVSLRQVVDRRGAGSLAVVEQFSAIIDSAFIV